MKCEGTKPDGERCRITVADGTRLCIWHDRSQAGRRRAATVRKRGGKESARKKLEGRIKTVSASEAPPAPETIQDCARWASWATHAVAVGLIDARTADAVGKLLNALQRALRDSKVESDVAELRAQVAELRRGSMRVR